MLNAPVGINGLNLYDKRRYMIFVAPERHELVAIPNRAVSKKMSKTFDLACVSGMAYSFSFFSRQEKQMFMYLNKQCFYKCLCLQNINE